ncbi:MAG: GNAT family N-acetyltransferase [Myxococcota bacterium]|nr:GNAT family N-acetyltransferase [Myxococcota bacterium]
MSEPDRLEISLAPSLAEVDAAEWDALVHPDDPFCTWDFLRLLETSGSACADTGWQPAHPLVHQAGRLIGAAPAYLKGHSYGEYIFDWGWAQAAERAQLPYYPKVLSAVPFTPATGRRLLCHPEADRTGTEPAVWAGLRHLADAADASSVHVLFLTEAEKATIAACDAGAISRLTHQFHWTNAGYEHWDEWVSGFRAKVRKETRRERCAPDKLGVEVRVVPGDQLEDADWTALEDFYRATIDKKWSHHYLTEAWFAEARTALKRLAMGILAVDARGRRVAGALCFQRGRHLYGRYWGCRPGYEKLHFEVCYHRPIALCIERGWTRFEAGAQGMHKLRRGLMPSGTHSLHWLRHDGLAGAIRDFCAREGAQNQRQMAAMNQHGPFRRGERGG